MGYSLRCLLVFAVLTFSAYGAPGPLSAQEGCRISVDTILAAGNDAVVDPQLKRHIAELQSMLRYTSYRLLSSQSLTLSAGKAGMVILPGDRRLKITFKKIHGSRADMALRMTKQERTVFETQIQLLNRGSLFIGGPTYQNGNLIFKITCVY